MTSFAQHVQEWLAVHLPALPFTIQVAVVIIILCGLAFALIAGFIFIRRFRQNLLSARLAKYKELIIDMLAHIVLFDELDDVPRAVENFVPRFKKLPLHRSEVRELFVKELLIYHANFTGKTAEVLKGIYLGLRLHLAARKKMASWHPERQIEAIHEITQLWLRDEANHILKLTDVKHASLRMEAQASFVKLSTADSFRFLDTLRERILDWHQLVLFEVVTKTRNVRIPSFAKWLSSENDSVIMLCLKLVEHYQQLETIPNLIQLLSHPNVAVRTRAVQVLGRLEAEVAENDLFSMYPGQPEEIRSEILQSMGRISSGNYLDFLTSVIANEVFKLKMTAIRSIKAHGQRGQDLLMDIYRTTTAQNRLIIKHVFDERIKA